MSTDTQSKIQAAAARFTEQVLAIFGEAFSAVASDLAVQAPAKSKPTPKKKQLAAKPVARAASAAKPKAAPKPAKPAKPGKRIRRSGQQLLEDAQRVIKLLAANKKGLRIEQINKQLGTSTKQLARPIQKLLDEGKIKKTGEKRATTYFPG